MNKSTILTRAGDSIHLTEIVVIAALSAGSASAAAPFPAEILQQEGRLTNSLSVEYDGFGRSVDMSGDRAVVGSYGRVDVFHRGNGANWSLYGSLSAPGQDSFGENVALENGTLVVSTFDSDEGGSRLYVFEHIGSPGLNAWNTTDHSVSSGVYYRYNHPLTTNERQLAATEGWTLTIRGRMVDDFQSTASCFVDIVFGNRCRLN